MRMAGAEGGRAGYIYEMEMTVVVEAVAQTVWLVMKGGQV